ncbi:MAG: HupE/UreJ family protein [Verrucomicrobiota bacterium JB023]|nr:HupE/UreJ family protein [Verrucomicrobiota bacterium JB023]
MLVPFASGHQVDQHFLKLFLQDGHLTGRLEMDAGYCLPDLRSADDETLPTNDWLAAKTDAERDRILIEGKKYLSSILLFQLGGEQRVPDIGFGKWGTDWPVYFDQRGDTFARMVWDVRLDYGLASGHLELVWNEDEDGPSLALAIESNGKDLPLSTVDQGEERSLAYVTPGRKAEPNRAVFSSWWAWLVAGFEHVLPLGLDHILFILGLYFLSAKWKPLLAQSLVFTVAHTITLGLTVAGIIPFDGEIVEPLIALSIAYVAIENLFFEEVKPWRLSLIFGLGLLHGMGFGSVMSELPVDRSSLLIPVLNFNLGVEIAQVAVLAMAFAATCWFHHKPSWKVIRVVASVLIALVGLYWTVERVANAMKPDETTEVQTQLTLS